MSTLQVMLFVAVYLFHMFSNFFFFFLTNKDVLSKWYTCKTLRANGEPRRYASNNYTISIMRHSIAIANKTKSNHHLRVHNVERFQRRAIPISNTKPTITKNVLEGKNNDFFTYLMTDNRIAKCPSQ